MLWRHRLAVTLLTIALAALTAPEVLGAGRGLVYGGVTKQDWPVIVRVWRDRSHVRLAQSGFDVRCSSGDTIYDVDSYEDLRINRFGSFRSSYRDQVEDDGSGGTTTYSGSLSGKFNAARTSVTLTWRLHEVLRDSEDVVTDTCDSGLVRVTAKD